MGSRTLQDPQFEVVLAGTDPHTTAVFEDFADLNRLRLVEAEPTSIPKLLKKGWENWVVLVLDDSIEHCRQLLSLVRSTRPSLAVIVVTARCQLEYAMAISEFNPHALLLKPCDVFEVNRWCEAPLMAKISSRSESKISRPEVEDFPLHCDRCNIELNRRERNAQSEKHEGILTLAEVERRHICAVVAQLGNDHLKAAKVLGMGKTTLYRKLQEYGYGRKVKLPRKQSESPEISESPEVSESPDVSKSNDQWNQLAVLKKQAESVFEKVKEFERRIVGRG